MPNCKRFQNIESMAVSGFDREIQKWQSNQYDWNGNDGYNDVTVDGEKETDFEIQNRWACVFLRLIFINKRKSVAEKGWADFDREMPLWQKNYCT